jgi:hypothetical protein
MTVASGVQCACSLIWPAAQQFSGSAGVMSATLCTRVCEPAACLGCAAALVRSVALERGLINCQGKTPEATMASALYTDVKRKHNKSVFTRCAYSPACCLHLHGTPYGHVSCCGEAAEPRLHAKKSTGPMLFGCGTSNHVIHASCHAGLRLTCRPQEGLFGLREWIAEGFFPEGWSVPEDSEGVAPYKRRGAPIGTRVRAFGAACLTRSVCFLTQE